MYSTAKRQIGAVLLTSLVLLLVITIIGLAGMKSAVMQEKMASNAQNSNRAFQAAESAVHALLTELRGNNSSRLTAAMNSATNIDTATTLNIQDTQVSASNQVRYLGEIILDTGFSLNADESSTDIKGHRFELIGDAGVSAVQAQARVHRGIEYR